MRAEDFQKLTKDQQDQLIAKLAEIETIAKSVVNDEKTLPQLSMKEFEERIKGVMETHMKGMTKVDKKYFVFPGIGNEPKTLDDLTPEGKFGKTRLFLKALVGRNTQVLNAMHDEVRIQKNLSEGTTTAGGFLVPEEFLAEIMRLEPEFGVIRRNCRIIPMKYDTLNIPAAGTTKQSANWTNEAAQILQTDPTFRQLTLTINKLAALPQVSNELLDDANVDVIQYLAMIIAEAMAEAEDQQGFNGTGSPFVGTLQATGVPTTPLASGTAMTMLSYPDLVKATTNVYSNVASSSKFYFHRTMVGHLRSLVTTAGAPIFEPTGRTLVGYPLEIAEKMPATSSASAAVGTYPFALFGDLRRGLAMGERGTMQMEISREATVASNNMFEKDMSALRVIERVAMGVLLPSAFTRITT